MRPAAFFYLSCAVHGAAVAAALGFSAYAGSRTAMTPPLVQVQATEPSAPADAAPQDVPDVVVEAVVDEPIAEAREVGEAARAFDAPVAEAEATTPSPQPTLQRIARVPPPPAEASPAATPAALPQAWVEAKPAAANEPPTFPESERLAGREDTVVVAITVDDRGEVLDVALRRASRYAAFNREALRAARAWRFEPARRHGVAVATTFDKRIEFRLEPVAGRR